VVSSTLLVTTVWLVQSTELASYGMLAQVNVSRLSEVITMKCWMPASMLLAINWRRPRQMALRESIMSSLVPACLYWTATRTRYLKYPSTLRATRW